MGGVTQTMNGPHDGDPGLGQRIHLPGEDHQLLQANPALQQIPPGDALTRRFSRPQAGGHDAAAHQLLGGHQLAGRLQLTTNGAPLFIPPLVGEKSH